jgi:hypothetical protein
MNARERAAFGRWRCHVQEVGYAALHSGGETIWCSGNLGDPFGPGFAALRCRFGSVPSGQELTGDTKRECPLRPRI